MKKYIVEYYIKHKFLCLLFIVFLIMGCESFVEVDHPDSQLTSEMVFKDVATAEAAMANIYSKLTSQVLVCGNSNGISILLGSYTDEIHTHNSGLLEFQFYQNNLNATNSEIAGLWNKSYNLIYAVNAIIEGLENSILNENDKNRLQGEALFLRAFLHFHLMNLYGSIPYITSTNYSINSTINKSSQAELYTLLVSDLEHAKEVMPASYGITNFRADLGAIKSLLARIYLYHQNWEGAEREADSVINSGNYLWVDSLDEVFLKGSTGTIWQLKTSNEGQATLEGENFIFTMVPPPSRAMTEHLLNAFESGDMRKERWIDSVSGENDTYYYPFKYKQNTYEAVSTEYSIMIRLEELYLIRAEARLKLGDSEGAKEDINKIRNRAALPNLIAATHQELLDAILHERRVELFCELGHRFFDLKRTGKIDMVLSAIKPGWNPTDILWPLPESELLLNPNLLPQNPGY